MSGRKLYLLAPLFVCLCALSPGVRAQTNDRAKAAAEIESLREQIKARESILLAPSNEDRQTYADFLAQPHTGLIRLLPREKWDSKLSMRGGGAYYSFARLTQEYGSGSDISLEQDNFRVGFNGANFGFIVNLGDTPLENVMIEGEAVRRLAEFQTPAQESGARAQQRRASDGFTEGGRAYIDRQTVIANNTYVLRSVNYLVSDVLVAFRVVRRDSDGSVVLLWKMLKKFPEPRLESDGARQD